MRRLERVSAADIRPARPQEASELSALALRSKGHWGYSAAFLEACRAELAVSPQQCESGDVVVAMTGGRIGGFYMLAGPPPEGQLSALFVDHDLIGAGLGHELLTNALETAVEHGFRSLVLDADPGAESFYAKYGAETTGRSGSGSIPGRFLPQMRFRLGGRTDITAARS